MQKEKNKILAFDTSNYTTSLAVTNQAEDILLDLRKGLEVKQGERGLRQSHALFQHLENLPALLEQAFEIIKGEDLAAVAVSDRPRPVNGSYMPVFRAGESFGRSLAAAFNVPLFRFSHQEGHLAAAGYRGAICNGEPYLAYHLSGGTAELLLVTSEGHEILGGSRDISFGQLIDRAGVAMDMVFPAGGKMDELALAYEEGLAQGEESPFTPIKSEGLWINLSGTETQFRKLLEGHPCMEGKAPTLAYHLFSTIGNCLVALTESAVEKTACSRVLFSGGVAASSFLRRKLDEYFSGKELLLSFGTPRLSSDNGVGVALLGGKALWQ